MQAVAKIVELETVEPGGEGPSAEGILSVERALAVIEQLADLPGGRSHSEIARRLGVNKSIAAKLLTSLERAGYVFRHQQTGQYCLTYKVSNLGLRQLARTNLLDQSSVVLRTLADATGELVRLAVVEQDRVTWVAASVGQKRTLQIDPAYGLDIRLHIHAAGKAWVAMLPFEEAWPLIMARGIQAATPHTLTSAQAIRDDLAEARRRGFAMSYEEGELGVGAIAAPVMVRQIDGAGRCVGSVSLAAPTSRMSRADLEASAPLVINTAQRLAEIWPVMKPPGANAF
jgi:IclR family acetate operon transcriptional repressor